MILDAELSRVKLTTDQLDWHVGDYTVESIFNHTGLPASSTTRTIRIFGVSFGKTSRSRVECGSSGAFLDRSQHVSCLDREIDV
jgi:hypothetical protein